MTGINTTRKGGQLMQSSHYQNGDHTMVDDSTIVSPLMVNGELEEMKEDAQVHAEGETEQIRMCNGDAAKTEDPADQKMAAEIKYLEKRYNKKGDTYITSFVDSAPPAETVEWKDKFAICVTRHMTPDNRLVERQSLEINSLPLKSLLGDVIGEFPGQSFNTKKVSVDFPARSLFHYRHELASLGNERFEDGSDGAIHLQLLLGFIEKQFEETIAEVDNLLEQGLILYEHLWTLFRPGTIVFARKFGQPRAFKLKCYEYVCGITNYLRLGVEYVNYDGQRFGTMEADLSIPRYRGTRPITSFPAFPIQFCDAPEEMEQTLITRGRAFETYVGQNLREYNGIALSLNGCTRYHVQSRVIIDTETCHRINANQAFQVLAIPGHESFHDTLSSVANRRPRRRMRETDALEVDGMSKGSKQHEPLTSEQCLLAESMVRGFSFTEKKFLQFFVDQLSPIEWNENCFNQLVLPETHKDTVRALVATQTARGSDSFDDIVKGKGKGLIFVLHGPPGTGKTLTAECVAEFAKRPLYIVSSGDLGTHPSTLDEKLSEILDLASTWRAVLLIDEADVFLEERSSHDVNRNALVSIFLRVLEYYEGILFLTTNRVKQFDDAFKSRIHVPLGYPELDLDSRQKIWKHFIAQTYNDRDAEIDDQTVESLSMAEINGRQIKNVVRTAKSLAEFHNKKLDQALLRQILDIQTQFEQVLNNPL